MADPLARFLEVAQSDNSVAPEAYEFLWHALIHTQRKLGRLTADQPGVEQTQAHVTAAELLEGVRECASAQFGQLAYFVFQTWGLHGTADIGRMVYRLIEHEIWRASPSDSESDFVNGFDFHDALLRAYRIPVEDISP